MSGSEQRSRNTTNNFNLYVQNTAQDKTFSTWGPVAGQPNNRIITEATAESETLDIIDQQSGSTLHLVSESRGERITQDNNRIAEKVQVEQLFEPVIDNPRDQAEDSSETPLAMALAQKTSSEHQNQADSFETVDFGSQGPPRYRQQADAGFFHCGRLIGVPSSYHNQALRGRTLLVLTVSNHGWAQCVCLCQHEGLNGRERRSFYRAHGAIYSEGPPRHFDRAEHAPIPAKMSNMEYKIREDCYVNFEHTFSLNRDFTVASLGTVEDKKKLIEVYQKVQKSMYENQIQAITAGEE